MRNNQQLGKDFSVPQRMSKSALVVICYNQLKQLSSFFFLIIVLKSFQHDSQSSFLLIFGKLLLILIGLIALSLVIGYLKYHFKRFYVKDGNLIFMHGIFHRETTNIPVYKIHSTRTKRGIIYRLLDMKGVSFDTLASKEEEIELILDDTDWNALLRLVEEEEQHTEETSVTESLQDDTDTDERSSTYTFTQTIQFSNLNLIKGAFCQNHLKGMAIVGSALLAFFGKVSEISDDAILYAFDYLAENTPEATFSITTFIMMLVILYFVVMFLWIGKVFLRYFNMEVRMNQTQLFFESGLLTRQSSQFSFDKVCTLYIKQNILEKWAKCCTINLKQAFNATDKKDESDVKIYGSDAAKDFLNWWLDKDYVSSKEIITAHSGKGLLGYSIRVDLLIILAAFTVLWHFGLIGWMIIPAIYLFICLVKGIFAVYRGSIILKEDYFIINNGQFAEIQNYLKYGNIEVVKLVKTPFTPYFHRVNLVIDTNGTSFVVRSLKENEASYIYELLLSYCRNKA